MPQRVVIPHAPVARLPHRALRMIRMEIGPSLCHHRGTREEVNAARDRNGEMPPLRLMHLSAEGGTRNTGSPRVGATKGDQ